jgi:hypothetical protein
LQALPVEFVQILESVRTVQLQDNPWTLLPEKWGHRRHQLQSSDAPWGYTLADALDFLYNMSLIYDCVEQIWEEYGVFYYTGRLSYEDYLLEIRQRIPNTWHEGLLENAKYLFFASKSQGRYVTWYELSPQQIEDRRKKRELNQQRHENQIEQSCQDVKIRLEKTQKAYHDHLSRRIRKAHDQLLEHTRGEEYIETLQNQALHESLLYTEKKLWHQHKKREQYVHHQMQNETNRMNKILLADATNRKMEKEYELQKERKKKHNVLSK